MADSSTGLCRPDPKGDGENTSGQDRPTDPSRLPWIAKKGQKGHQRQDSAGIDNRSRGPGSSGMLVERRISSLVQRGLCAPVDKRLSRGLTRFHDGGNDRSAKQDRKQTRGESTATMKENPYQNREAGHRKPDDRDVV